MLAHFPDACLFLSFLFAARRGSTRKRRFKIINTRSAFQTVTSSSVQYTFLLHGTAEPIRSPVSDSLTPSHVLRMFSFETVGTGEVQPLL